MCGWWYPRSKDLKELWNKHLFHIFDVGLRSKLMLYMNMWWIIKNMWRTHKKNLRTFKHIQENLNNYYHDLILNSHHDNIKKQVRERDYTFIQDSYNGKGDSWWSSYGWRKKIAKRGRWSHRKTKIWQDYSISLKLKRGEEKRFFCILE